MAQQMVASKGVMKVAYLVDSRVDSMASPLVVTREIHWVDSMVDYWAARSVG